MVAAAWNKPLDRPEPMTLVVNGEAESWMPALSKIVGPGLLDTRRVASTPELLEVVETGQADAAVLDDSADWDLPVLQMLRMIRRVSASLPVVVVSSNPDRRYLEQALQLAAFSVLSKPLEFEPLLRQIHRIMCRFERILRQGPGQS